MAYILATLAALAVGFIAGLLTLKRSNRWCPSCGHTLACTQCAHQPAGPPRTNAGLHYGIE